MTVKIGHAFMDENKKAKYGLAGDTNNKEVFVGDWYLHSKGWVLLRCIDFEKRQKIAEAMEKACSNPNIGYDQSQRNSLFNNVKSKKYDPSKTTKDVETDCSALVRVCIAYAYGKDITGDMRTVHLPDILVKTKLFKKYTGSKYCASSDYLKRGDILCTPVSGHVVVVLSDGVKVISKISTDVKGDYYSKSLIGNYVTTGALNIRYGVGVSKRKMIKIPKGTVVKSTGHYSVLSNRKWLRVKFFLNEITYTGFCNSKYLKKK